MPSPATPAPLADGPGWADVLAPRRRVRGGPDGAEDVLAAPLSVWQQSWRLGTVWLLGLVAWLFVGTVATSGWTVDVDGLAPLVVGLVLLDPLIGQVAVALVAFRRRWPLAVALVLGVLCLVSAFAIPASLLAIVSLATHRHGPSLALAVGVNFALDVVHTVWFGPQLGTQEPFLVEGRLALASLLSFGVNTLFVLLIYVVCVLAGWNIGSRRELVASLRTQARTATREQAARVAQAQLAERARIAREMHDVLAHRLSLVAMHAGVLAHRTDLPEQERREAAEVVRAGAHQALEELREVLGVLREDEDGQVAGDAVAAAVEAPQPGLSGIPSLVAEVSSSGQQVTLTADEQLWARSVHLPASTGRHAYRVVQEALTNARKHAPGAPAAVWLHGGPGEGLHVVVSNPLTGDGAGMPSGGRGLVGLAERAQLAGGRCEAGVEQEGFVVRVWLPWPREGER